MKDKFVEREGRGAVFAGGRGVAAKMMFRARWTLDAWTAPAAIEQVLSADNNEGRLLRPGCRRRGAGEAADVRRGIARTGLEMGLTAVTATQVWHHLSPRRRAAGDLPTRVKPSTPGDGPRGGVA